MKSALITGANRGIGKGIAKHLAKDNFEVAIHYRSDKESAEKVVEEIVSEGGKAFTIQADISSSK